MKGLETFIVVCAVFVNLSYSSPESSTRILRRQLATNNKETRIIGGTRTQKNKYPFAQVSLQTSTGVHQCGGSLIAPDVVMTAGHCYGFFTEVVVNRYNFSNNEEVFESFRAAHFTFHPHFEEEVFSHDILLVQLEKPVSSVRPVILNSIPDIPTKNDKLTVFGWGLTDMTDNTAYPNVPHQAIVSYLPNDECERAGDGHYSGDVHNEMLCAQDDGKDACAGDSGGPLIQTIGNINLQVGIVSWGRGCAGSYPGVYTRISYLYDWIKTNVCATSQQPPEYFSCQVRTTDQPTAAPTHPPTKPPTRVPTARPTLKPTAFPLLTVTVALPAPVPLPNQATEEYNVISTTPHVVASTGNHLDAVDSVPTTDDDVHFSNDVAGFRETLPEGDFDPNIASLFNRSGCFMMRLDLTFALLAGMGIIFCSYI